MASPVRAADPPASVKQLSTAELYAQLAPIVVDQSDSRSKFNKCVFRASIARRRAVRLRSRWADRDLLPLPSLEQLGKDL